MRYAGRRPWGRAAALTAPARPRRRAVAGQIYRAMIRDEEVQTGRKSTMPWDAPLLQVLENTDVREALTERTAGAGAATGRDGAGRDEGRFGGG